MDSHINQSDFFLGNLEQNTSLQNIMFAVYQQARHDFGVRPTLTALDELLTEDAINFKGVLFEWDKTNNQAYINDNKVVVPALFEGLKGSTDLEYNKQRRAYLTDTQTFQRRYIEFDSQGHIDALGREHNSTFNQRKAADALFELLPDNEHINPNGFFKTDLSASQKIRLMSAQIDTLKAEVKKNAHKLLSQEKKAIKQPLVDQQMQDNLKDMQAGTITLSEATSRDKTHEIDSRHEYFQSTLKGVDGLNNTRVFAIGHLKPMPKDYITQKEQLNAALAIDYSSADSKLAIIAKQLNAFYKAKEALASPVDIDFSQGVDLNRLYVSTKVLAGADIVDGNSCVVDAKERYHNVNTGEFGLPKSSMLNKAVTKYDSIAIATGASGAGAISTALKGKNVLVIDALEDANVNSVLASFRACHDLPIAVFTDNPKIHEYLMMSGDNKVSSHLSKTTKWGELGVDAIKNKNFNTFSELIETKLSASLNAKDPTPLNAIVRPMTAVTITPKTPDNHTQRLGR